MTAVAQDPVTAALYSAFAALCAYDAWALHRASGRWSRDVLWVCALSAVFVLCAATGYVTDWLGAPPRVEAPLHVALNLASAALVAYTLAARPIQRIGKAEARADRAEADTARAHTEADRRSRLLSDSLAHGDAIRQVMEVAPDPNGPLSAPDGTPHTLRILAASPAMRAFFYVPEDGAVEGQTHYSVYPGIYDEGAGEVLRPEWIADHQAAAEGRTIRSDGVASFVGPHGRRHFTFTITPYNVADGWAEAITFDCYDVTAEVAADRARADDLAARIASAELRAAHDALGKRIDAGADE